MEAEWQRPPGTPAGLKATVRVTQAESGEVRLVEIVESSGNRALDRSVEQAVRAATPLPTPKDKSLFARVIRFEFVVPGG